jgi:putative transposase
MPSAHVSCRLHCVWSTKDRKKLIPIEAQPRLWAYMDAVGRNLGVKTFAIGGIEDHVHLLIGLPPTIALAEVIQKIKANSSRWMKQEFKNGFAWQESYLAHSVSISRMDATIAYIRNQRTHHKKRDFVEELREILR